MICPTGEAEYLCKWDWTGQITLIRFNKFGQARTRRSKRSSPDGAKGVGDSDMQLHIGRAEGRDRRLPADGRRLAKRFVLRLEPEVQRRNYRSRTQSK